MNHKYRLGVIGGGFMAYAILSGAIGSRFLASDEIVVSDPNSENLMRFAKLGIHTVSDNCALVKNCNYILVAVKPQAFPAVARELNGMQMPVVLSIMAGKRKAAVSAALGGAKVARIMPNLPCSVGEGVSAIDAIDLSSEEKKFVFSLFDSVGRTLEIEEGMLDAVTAVSGSGPAYVFLFLKSLTEAGVREGLTPMQAKALAVQTMKGAVKMAENSEASFEESIAAVTSKGGTTAAALACFERDGFAGIVESAVSAAVRRAEELSDES